MLHTLDNYCINDQRMKEHLTATNKHLVKSKIKIFYIFLDLKNTFEKQKTQNRLFNKIYQNRGKGLLDSY